MAEKITLYDYLGYSEPDTQQAVMDLIRSRGYQINPRNDEDLVNDIMCFCNEEGDKGLEALAMVHPDRELILRTVKKPGIDESLQALPVSSSAPAVLPPQQFAMISHTPVIAGLMGIIVLGIVAIVCKK